MSRELEFRRYKLPRQSAAVDDVRRVRAIRGQYSTSTKRLVRRRPVVAQQQARPAPTRRSQDQSPLQRSLQLDMALPGDEVTRRKQPFSKAGKLRRLRKWTLRAALAALIVVVGIGGVLGVVSYWKVKKVFNGTGKVAAALQKNAAPDSLKGEGDGRVNVLLLGNGGGTHEAPDLTDTIILASIDPVTHRADLVSVPRDLWVSVPGYGSMKINAVYETGKYAYLHKIDNSNANHEAVDAGLKMADRSVEQVLGVDINYNVLVDFQAFRQAVDTVGGVTVTVPEQLYDPTMAWENDWNPVLAKAGLQTFDGRHALIYARSRETSSDFARSERQRALLVALKDRVLSLGTLSNPVKISQLLGAFGDNVQTDLSLNDMNRLLSIGKVTSNDKVKSIGLGDGPSQYVTTDHMGNQSVVRPLAGFFQYAAIQKYIRSTLVDGYIAKENARIVVLNGTANAGLGAEKADELKSYGYNVTSIGSAPTTSYQNTTVVDLTKGKDVYTSHYLAQRFGAKVSSTLPDKAIQAGQADFIIILGNDETFSGPD